MEKIKARLKNLTFPNQQGGLTPRTVKSDTGFIVGFTTSRSGTLLAIMVIDAEFITVPIDNLVYIHD